MRRNSELNGPKEKGKVKREKKKKKKEKRKRKKNKPQSEEERGGQKGCIGKKGQLFHRLLGMGHT